MGRRRNVELGAYNQSRMSSHCDASHSDLQDVIRLISRIATTYFWSAYYCINENYMTFATVILVLLLTFVLPDFSQNINRSNDLKSMKKTLDLMSREVSRAEVACLTVADQFSCLQCTMHDGATGTSRIQQDLAVCTSASMRTTQSAPVQVEKKIGFFQRIFFPNRKTSHKEVTIMSYLYTDSFDAKNNDMPEVTLA